MRISIRWTLTTLAALGLTSGVAWAAHHEAGEGKDHHKRHHAKKFEMKDTNGDGAVSLEEWTAASQARFTKIDADGDGAVTPEEMKAARKHRREHSKEKREN